MILKRIIGFGLALVMMFSSLSVGFAETVSEAEESVLAVDDMVLSESAVEVDGVTYPNLRSSDIYFDVSYENEEYNVYIDGTIVKCLSSDSTINIPSTVYYAGIVSVTISTIGYSAFADVAGNIVSVSMPDTISSIGSKAFANCTNLETISIPSSVTYIASDAFEGCSNNMVVFCEKGSCADNPSLYPDGVEIKHPLVECSDRSNADYYVDADTGTIVECSELDGHFISVQNIVYVSKSESQSIYGGSIPIKAIGDNAYTNVAKQLEIIDISNKNGVDNSITSIGSKAFSGASILEKLIIPSSVTYIASDAFEGCNNDVVVFCEKGSCADNPSLYPSGAEIRYEYKLSNSAAYRIPSVNTGDAIKVYDEFNSLRITPKLEITDGSYIYIKINNGSFDESMLSECEFKTKQTDTPYDTVYNYILWGRRINDALMMYIGNEGSRALPYKLEYVDSTTLKATLFPIGLDKVGFNNYDVTVGIPMYDIKLPAIAGSEQGKVTISVDGADTTIESCNDIVYAYNNGYTLSDSDYLPIDSQYAEREINAEPGQPILYNDSPNALIIKPTNEILDGDTITLKISNGSFDESMLEACEFRTNKTGKTYDEVYSYIEQGGRLYDALTMYIGNENSRQLPYKLEYVDSSTLKVHLFPIGDRFVNCNNDDVTQGTPIYRIALPTVAGSEDGYTKVAVDGGNSSIESGGWYTIARINSEADYESEFKWSSYFTVTNQVKVNSGSNVLYYDEPLALRVKPSIGIGKAESILINIKNGYFDEDLFNSCEFKTNYTDVTYDMLLKQLDAGRPLNYILQQYIVGEDSSQLPYKLEYVDSDTIKVWIFPINDADVGAATTVTKTNPIYSILLPVVAGEYNGDVEIAVDGNGSTIQTSGWYKLGTVENGTEVVKVPYEAIGGYFYFNKSTGAIVGADSGITSAVIPESIDGVSVTAIGSNVFSECTALASITIPDSVTVIGENAIANTATIYCSRGSYAETYAKENNISYKNTDVVVIKGDINGDEKVTAVDAMLIAQLASGRRTDEVMYSKADINGDGKVTAVDAMLVARYASGRISNL